MNGHTSRGIHASYGKCYVDTPVSVFKSSERCDTKRVKHCDPLYGFFTASRVFTYLSGKKEINTEIDREFWNYAEGRNGKLSDCQMQAISIIYSGYVYAAATGEYPIDSLKQIISYYVGTIINDFGNTDSDDCKAILSAVSYSIFALLVGLGGNLDDDFLFTTARTGMANAISTSPCCCKRDFIVKILGVPISTASPRQPAFRRLKAIQPDPLAQADPLGPSKQSQDGGVTKPFTSQSGDPTNLKAPITSIAIPRLLFFTQ